MHLGHLGNQRLVTGTAGEFFCYSFVEEAAYSTVRMAALPMPTSFIECVLMDVLHARWSSEKNRVAMPIDDDTGYEQGA